MTRVHGFTHLDHELIQFVAVRARGRVLLLQQVMATARRVAVVVHAGGGSGGGAVGAAEKAAVNSWEAGAATVRSSYDDK